MMECGFHTVLNSLAPCPLTDPLTDSCATYLGRNVMPRRIILTDRQRRVALFDLPTNETSTRCAITS